MLGVMSVDDPLRGYVICARSHINLSSYSGRSAWILE